MLKPFGKKFGNLLEDINKVEKYLMGPSNKIIVVISQMYIGRVIRKHRFS